MGTISKSLPLDSKIVLSRNQATVWTVNFLLDGVAEDLTNDTVSWTVTRKQGGAALAGFPLAGVIVAPATDGVATFTFTEALVEAISAPDDTTYLIYEITRAEGGSVPLVWFRGPFIVIPGVVP